MPPGTGAAGAKYKIGGGDGAVDGSVIHGAMTHRMTHRMTRRWPVMFTLPLLSFACAAPRPAAPGGSGTSVASSTAVTGGPRSSFPGAGAPTMLQSTTPFVSLEGPFWVS